MKLIVLSRYFQVLSLLIFCVFSLQAKALSVDWGGTYRFEYVQVDTPSLSSNNTQKKYYFLNHLNLTPKIITVDGINVVANIEVLPSTPYPNSQLGQGFGTGLSPATASNPSATAGSNAGSSTLSVNQLYMTINQEYGAFVAGRAPVQFGLGITHNAGNGLFDHWYNSHDMVGYKILIGNLSIMPMMGRPYKESFAQGSETQEMMWDIEYNNPETESNFSVFYQTRSASISGNDGYKFLGKTAADRSGGWNTQHTNIYIARGWEPLKLRLEAGFQSGGTGVSNNNEEIKVNGYGIALELDFPSPSLWNWNLKTGIVSGDNPNTTTFEGYFLNRNYDVAFLLFNHPMGQYDIFRNNFQRDKDISCSTLPCSPYAVGQSADDMAISNAVYVAPRVTYKMNDKWDWTNTFAWAQLQTIPTATPNDNTSKDVGYEWDTGFTYKPHEKVRWITEMGFFFPGSAWAGGTNNYDTNFTYGLQTKAAISF